MVKTIIEDPVGNKFGYSGAVVTSGGKLVWLAGHVGTHNELGEPLSGDFSSQAQQTFRNLEATLAKAGGTLTDIVSMTVFLRNPSDAAEMTKIRRQALGSDFPASAAISVCAFPNPNILIEIQGTAVLNAT